MNTEDQFLLLKKDCSVKENEWKKDKAVFTQKIQLLEMQLEEYRSRENNQKHLNDTIMSALNDVSKPQNKVFKGLIQNLDNQSKDSKKNETIREVESQYRQLKDQYDDQEGHIKEQQYKYEKEILQYKHQIEMLQQNQLKQDKELKDKVKLYEQHIHELQKQQKQDSSSLNMQFKAKSDEKHIIMEQSYQQQIEQLVNIHSQEKDQLNQRIIKCQNLIKKYQTHLDNNRSVQEIENVYQQEISKLKLQIDQQGLQYEYEKKQMIEQIEDGNKIIQSLELQMLKQKRNDDQLRSSQVFKENNVPKFASSHKKNSNASLLSKIENQSYRQSKEQQFHIRPQKTGFQFLDALNSTIINETREALKLPDHIQAFNGQSGKNSECLLTKPQDRFSGRVDNTLPISIDQYNILKNKRSNNMLSTLNFNEKSGSSSQIDQSQIIYNENQGKWIQEQLTKRSSNECYQQQLKKTEMVRKSSQTSIKQLNNILGREENDKYGKVNEFNRSVEDAIMETSLEQNKDTEQGGYYVQQDPIQTRTRVYSQNVQHTQNSGLKFNQDYDDKTQNQSYIHETFNPLITTQNTYRNNTNRGGKLNSRYPIHEDPHNELDHMDLSNIEKNLKEQIMLMNSQSQASNDSQVNQEIKYLIGKLLRAKGKLTEGLNKSQNKSQSMSVLGKVNASQNQSTSNSSSFYAQHRKANQSIQVLPKARTQTSSGGLQMKTRHMKIRSSNFPE